MRDISLKKKNVDIVVDSNNKYGERKKEISYFCDTWDRKALSFI